MEGFWKLGKIITSVYLLTLVNISNAVQLNENCVINILNRTIQVAPDGGWSLPNVPSNQGRIRARATCISDLGETSSGQTDYFSIVQNGITRVGDIVFVNPEPIPTELNFDSAIDISLSSVGATEQLTVIATYADASTVDVTNSSAGINYASTNVNVTTVNADGLVTAVSSGSALISARKDGVIVVRRVVVNVTGDSDNDGLPDDFETAQGLNPNDPVDAFEDQDGDGLSALEEYNVGTDINNSDTDGDGIEDKEELEPGVDGYTTDPLLADTDGDGLSDGAEVLVGSSPVDGNDTNFQDAVTSLTIVPDTVVMTFNTINTEVSTQLTVTGNLIDGGTIDLTSTSMGTTYTSSDLTVVSFGLTDGKLFAGQAGTATVTVNYFAIEEIINVTVEAFEPAALSAVDIPGYANNVDVAGDYAFISAGASGLQVVDVSDRSNPSVVGSLDTTGTAIDVRIVGNLAYIADGESGLQIIDISDPLLPLAVSTYDTAGVAQDIKVDLQYAYIAGGNGGLTIIDVSDPLTPFSVGQLAFASAKGVDVDGNTAVVVSGTSLHIVDVSNKSDPINMGSVNIGPVKDVVVSGNYAYIAAYGSGYRVVNITDPTAPVIVGGDSSIAPRDVELTNGFAFFAEQLFPNVVAFVNIQNPEDPFFQGIIDLSPFGDYAGTGIAMDASYAYITEESYVVTSDYKATGTSRLFIAQYRLINDNVGIAPTVSITMPVDNDVVVEGSSITVVVDAQDDIAVASVSFYVNDILLTSDTTMPYQIPITVPGGAAAMTLRASAVDLGGSVGESNTINLIVQPDTDGDGLGDGEETNTYGTDPNNPDSDNDGLSDGEEVARGTNPLNADSDNDGIDDKTEVDQGTDPLNPDTTAPLVDLVNPADGSIDIAENTAVIVTFNEALQPKSVISSRFQLSKDTVPVNGILKLINNDTQLLFTPSALLADYTLYDIRVEDVRDAAGNPLTAPFISSFTTGNTVDTERPYVVSSNPQANAVNIPVNAVISLLMNEPIDPTTVTEDSFYVHDTLLGQRVAGSVSVSEDKTVLSFVPVAAFPVGRRYYSYLTNAAKDLFGNTHSNSYRYFTTTFNADAVGPEVDEVTVFDGQIDLPTNIRISVRFNEPVSSISQLGISLTDSNGDRVPLDHAISADHLSITATPKLPLTINSTFNLLIADVQDLSGNFLANSVTRSFTTGAVTDTQTGTVQQYTPIANSQNVASNPVIQARLSEMVDPVTVTNTTVSLYDNTGGFYVAGTRQVSQDRRMVSFVPDASLEQNHVYYFYAGYSSNRFYDYAGNRINGSYSYFTVGAPDDTSVPALTVSIADGATDIPINGRVVLEVDSAVNAFCANNTSLQLMAGGVAVDSTITLANDQRTITLTPANPLTISTQYTLLINGLCDLSGNILSGFSSSFTSSSATVADTTRPSVSVTPAYAATGVDVNTNIVFSFNEPVDPTSIDTISVAINGIAGQIAGNFSLNVNELTFTPDSPLPGNSRVNLSSYYVTDYVGNYPPTGYNSYFTTAAETAVTVPVVEMISPVDNALDIGITSPVVLSFSEPMHPATINNTNFAFYVNGAVIRPNVSRSGDNRTVTLRSTLPANSVVSVVVTNDVTDLSGTNMADFISVFTTGGGNDTGRPSVTSMYPANGSSNVADTCSVVLYTNESMDETTLDSALYVSQNGILIAGTLTVLGNGQALEFTPAQPLLADALIQVFLQSTATDVAGNALNNFQAQFRVAADLSNTAPTVVDYLGGHYYYSGLPTNPRMDVRFSEALNPATVDTTSVLLYDNNTNQIVDSTVSLSSDGRVVRVTPTNLLSLDQYFYVRVTTAVQDLDGSALAVNYTGYFYITADATQDTQAPHVSSMTPADGAENVGINALTHIRFDEPMNPISLESELANANRSVTYSSTNNEATIHPHIPLTASSSITESVTDVVDRGGNPVIAASVTYTTDAGPDFVRPVVLLRDPYNNAQNIPVNTVIAVSLNEVIDPTSISETSVYLYDATTTDRLPGNLTLDNSGVTLHFVPDQALAVGRQYYFYFSGLKDFSGNLCNGCSYLYFTTSFVDDTAIPVVEEISFMEGQADLPINSRALVRFNEPVTSLSMTGIQLLDNTNNPLAVNRSISSDHRLVTLVPQQLLAANSNYQVSISGVQDNSGNTAVNTLRTFSTGIGADLQTGAVQQYVPIANSQNVASNPVMQVRLSEMIDPATVDSNTLRLYDNNDAVYISGTRQVSTDRQTLTFTPDVSLEQGHLYYFYAGYSSNRFYDYAGNRINGSYTYFTVGAGDDTSAPVLNPVLLMVQ